MVYVKSLTNWILLMIKTSGERSSHVAFMVPTDQLIYTTLMAMINWKGGGFAIHGFIDGFSRKIVWLRVSTSNNDPLIIANFYLSCISKYNVCPRYLRMDCGDENIYYEYLQVFFNENPESFIYSASIHNQWIESFWARFKQVDGLNTLRKWPNMAHTRRISKRIKRH